MDDFVIVIKNLSHRYSKEWALKDLDLKISRKGIVGLLGANGAGKSTLMNIMCGVIYQTQGDVFIEGVDIRENSLEAKKLIGYQPQQVPLHLELTVKEYLTFCTQLRQVPQNNVASAVDYVMEKCGLTHFSRRLISNLSGGYRQRVGIAQAIVHNPKVVILDEPTNGLDPNQILAVRSLIKEIAKEQFVILSSHILSEVQAICSDIIMIDHGQVVFNGSMNDFDEYTEPTVVELTMEAPPASEKFLTLPRISEANYITENRVALRFSGGQDIAQVLISASLEQDWQLREIVFKRSTLDETFAQLSKINLKTG